MSHIGVVRLADAPRARGAAARDRPRVRRGRASSATRSWAALGQALITKEVAQRFRPTGLVGAVGAAAAGARLLRLSEDETVNALALAANTAGGLNEWPRSGGGEMFFHPGFAARNAVTRGAARARRRRGVGVGARRAGGAVRRVRRRAARGARARRRLGDPRRISQAGRRPAITRRRRRRRRSPCAARTRSAPRDIEQVVVRSFPEAIAYPGCDHAGPYRTQLQAKMSIQFTVAAVLVHGRLDDEVFRAFAADGEVAGLARRVRLENDAELARGYPQRQGAEVIVTLRDGRSVDRRLAELEPLDAAGVRRRTRAALARLLGDARAARGRARDRRDHRLARRRAPRAAARPRLRGRRWRRCRRAGPSRT